MSGSASGMRGGTPSTTTPIAGPWLSPQVVNRNSVPKELPAMVQGPTRQGSRRLLGRQLVAPAVDWDFAPVAVAAHAVAQGRRSCRIDDRRIAGQDDAVIVARRAKADEIVQHVLQHQGGVAVERVAPAAATGNLVPE